MTKPLTLFQTALRQTAERHTMKVLAERCGIPRGNLTSYMTGRSRPSVEAIEAIAGALLSTERAPLILAHLLDECPAVCRPELILELSPYLGSSLQEGAGPDMELDALFSALRQLALSRPAVREWLKKSLELIR